MCRRVFTVCCCSSPEAVHPSERAQPQFLALHPPVRGDVPGQPAGHYLPLLLPARLLGLHPFCVRLHVSKALCSQNSTRKLIKPGSLLIEFERGAGTRNHCRHSLQIRSDRNALERDGFPQAVPRQHCGITLDCMGYPGIALYKEVVCAIHGDSLVLSSAL